MANALSLGIQKITYASFRELGATPGTDRLLVLPSPAEFSWDLGVEELEIKQTSGLGELYTADIVPTEKNPQFTLGFGSLTKEVLALKTGFKLASQADVGIYAKTLQVKQDTYPAVLAGQDGFGMVADTAEASVLRSGVSIPLTRQPFAGFAGATVNTFAQGANATFKFSNDIVAAKEYVTVYGEYPLTAAEVLTEDLFDTFTVSLIGVMHDKTVFNLIFDPVVLSRAESGEIDFGAETQEITYRITDDGCVPKLKFLNARRAC